MKAVLITFIVSCFTLISAQDESANKTQSQSADSVESLLKGLMQLSESVEAEGGAVDDSITQLLKFGAAIVKENQTEDQAAGVAELLGAMSKSLNSTANSADPGGEPTLDSVLLDFFAASSKILEEVVSEQSVTRNPNDPTLDSTVLDFMDVGTRMMTEMVGEMPEVLEALEQIANSAQGGAQSVPVQSELERLKQENEEMKKQLELQK